MPVMHLKQPRFTYSIYSGRFTKNKERIQKFKEAGDTSLIRYAFNMIWLMDILKI